VPQALADTGLIGLAVSLALLIAWLAASARTLGFVPRIRRLGTGMRRRDWDSERIALAALFIVALVFGLQSAIDWTWFVVGPAVMALVAAGFVAGRGPVGAPAGAPATAVLGGAPQVRWKRGDRMRTAPAEPSRLVAAGAIAVCAILFAWAIWEPEASDRASNSALELSDQKQYQAAVDKAEDAAGANPLSPRPLYVQAATLTEAGDVRAARGTLERAVLKFPGDPQTWLRLATFQLLTLDRPDLALQTVQGTLYLDPLSRPAQALYLQARQRERAKAGAP
jgi:tetratricopeptide (TPR) repeat protein